MTDTGLQDQQLEQRRKRASDIKALWRKYSDKASAWRQVAMENRRFRLGEQWTREQEAELARRGQAALVDNRIHPAVETGKALLTANRPAFRAAAREDSDVKVARVIDDLLAYVWDTSDGMAQFRAALDNYYVDGIGYLYA